MTIYFTSDTHFGHTKVIQYSNRPFSNVEEMDESLITNWNNRVSKHDTIYHLGDFSFSRDPAKYFNRLNGNKILIRGNHDPKQTTCKLPWSAIHNLYEFKYEGYNLVLCHYVMRVWNKSRYGAIQLYGHSHGTLAGTSQSTDVGVDCWNYAPVTLEEIIERLNTNEPFFKQ
jgi:calcineurin-like phosphoesterase family protein